MNGELAEKISCPDCHSFSVTIKIDIFGIKRVTCWNQQCKEESQFRTKVPIMTSGISKRINGNRSTGCFAYCVCEDCWPELEEM